MLRKFLFSYFLNWSSHTFSYIGKINYKHKNKPLDNRKFVLSDLTKNSENL
ncbi:hypothetical protein PGB90_001664 [Kerria lacca]